MDALLYGHLVTSRNEPSLYAMLSKHPLLLEFHKRILTTYFPDDLTQSGVGYLCTQGLNVFEQHDKDAEKARAAAKGKGTGTSVDTGASLSLSLPADLRSRDLLSYVHNMALFLAAVFTGMCFFCPQRM